MSPSEHLRQLLSQRPGVRPAVSCWYHFPPECHEPARAVSAHLRHREKYGLDFIKVMCEVGYPRQALGAARALRSAADLGKLGELPGDTPPFDTQLEILRQLSARLAGEVPTSTTIFNAWATLRRLTEPPPEIHGPPAIELRDDPRDRKLTELLREDSAAVAAALGAIGRTLANFARACIESGADGIYPSVRDDWVDTPANRRALGREASGPSAGDSSSGPGPSVYDELVAEGDRAILAGAARGWFNILHLCGRPLRFERHARQPQVQVFHWADRITGPSIAEAKRRLACGAGPAAPKAIAAGVDNLRTLPSGSPEQVAAEARAAVAAAAGHPLIVAPGCTYDPQAVRDENIRAMVAAARGEPVP